jgi:type I restriction enzyme M protein
MNMVMNNDGHGNIFSFNSLEFPASSEPDVLLAQNKIPFESFDFVFTNPPFGAKIPVDDPAILEQYELARRWKKNERGEWAAFGLHAKVPPEILFIERCYHWLKPGAGKLAIVLPDGILGNPDLEYVRAWILRKTQVLASIDLPVEAFLPQVGVQASLLFLRRKSEEEMAAERMGSNRPYDVFMAVAEKVGRDRRGNKTYVRNADGAELLFDVFEEEIRIRGNQRMVHIITIKDKKLDDDLPRIAEAYTRYREKLAEVPE